MTLAEKRKLVEKNRDPTLQALNVYLDKQYALTDKYFKDNKLIKDFFKDKKLEKFIFEVREDCKKYEDARRKILDNQYEELSLADINYIALAFSFIMISWKEQIKNLNKATEELSPIIKGLLSKE